MYPQGKIEGEPLIVVIDSKPHTKRSRTGIYDENILCADCDGILGNLDDYGKKVFLETELAPFDSAEGLAFYLPGIDPLKLKVFILSILWRLYISTLPESGNIPLNKKFSEKLFYMVKNGDAGSLNDFSVVLRRFNYSESEKEWAKYYQTPVRAQHEGIDYINVYFPNGYKILIKVDERPQLANLAPLTLQSGKLVHVLTYENFKDAPEYKRLMANAHKIKPRRIL